MLSQKLLVDVGRQPKSERPALILLASLLSILELWGQVYVII
jgi:hypothetical protein